MIQLFHPKYEVEECLAELRDVLESGWTGTGPKCAKFERTWNDFIGCEHSLFLNSATSALHLALKLLDLPKGSKVATTPTTFVSTNSVILQEGLTPVFCDVDMHDLSLTCSSVVEAVEDGAKAVLWVHYGGNVSDDFYRFMGWKPDDVTVIEDCAHAAGAYYKDGSRVGSRADTLSCFSFQAVKNLPTCDSGILVVRSEAELERARRLSWLGIDKSTYQRSSEDGGVYKWLYDVPELGFKYNGNDVTAAIALVQLRYLDRDNAFRSQIYRWYRQAIPHHFGSLMEHNEGSSHHLCVFHSDRRDKIMAALKLADIHPGVHYRPNYDYAPFLKYKPEGARASSFQIDDVISLPNHLRLTHSDVKRISGIVNRCFL